MKRFLSVISLSAAVGLVFSAAVPAAGTGGSSDSQDVAEKLDRAEKLIESGNYRDAVPVLDKVVSADENNANAYNYLGYAYRHLGEYDKSKQYYDRALAIDADHRGAREYLGELYLELDDLDSAQQQLAKLDEICTTGCSEYDELKRAIDEYEQSQ